LLALARNDAAALLHEPFDLDDLVREVATRLLSLARAKSLDFGVDRGTEPCIAEGDRQLLGEAIANLAHNAVCYTPDRGQVTLAATQDREGFEVRVSNSGDPIPERVTARLGDRFVKGDTSRGAGLGLAIAKSIVERHGGILRVTRLEAAGLNCMALRWPRLRVTP
jgi:two-component system sensor histidine kinase TctE